MGFVKDALEGIDCLGAYYTPYFNKSARAVSKPMCGNGIFYPSA